MEYSSPELNFPTGFCCNCGDMNCASDVQLTRVTRYFGLYKSGTTFQLPLPVCNGCRRTLRRRPSIFFMRVLVFVLFSGGCLLALWALAASVQLPQWMLENRFYIGVFLGSVGTIIFYRLRSAKPPRTSFYQPVRIKQAKVQVAGLMGGPAAVMHMKLAFTNADYLNAFANANAEAIKSGHLAAVRA